MDFSKKNKAQNTVNESIDTKELEFKPLKDFVGKRVRAWGFFHTKSKFGYQTVLVGEVDGNNVLINLPKRYYDEFSTFTTDEIEAVKNGEMALENIKELDSSNGKTVVFDYANF